MQVTTCFRRRAFAENTFSTAPQPRDTSYLDLFAAGNGAQVDTASIDEDVECYNSYENWEPAMLLYVVEQCGETNYKTCLPLIINYALSSVACYMPGLGPNLDEQKAA